MKRKWSPNPLHRYRLTYPFGFVARNPERVPLQFSTKDLFRIFDICWARPVIQNIREQNRQMWSAGNGQG